MQRKEQGEAYVVHIDASGQVTGSTKGGDRIVTSQDGVELSWVEGGKLYLDGTNGHSDQPQSLDLPQGIVEAHPVGFVGSRCGPRLRHRRRRRSSSRLGPPGALAAEGRRALGAGHRPVARRPRRADVLQRPTGTSCWAVRTNSGGTGPKTCDWTIERVQHRRRALRGLPVRHRRTRLGDGRPCSTRPPRSRSSPSSGRATATPSSPTSPGRTRPTRWRPLHEDGRWYLVRLGLDGSLERLDEASGAAEESPFHFAARP